jgi:NAD(P)-dependent dehydrogenase (short-subunit alcohol dehydrogenase family)
MTKRFENKVVVITGGGDGIGLTTPKLFASEGASVYITGRRQEPLEKAVAEIGNGAVGVRGDVAESDDVVRLYNRILADHGRVDVVFANAGIYEVVGLEDIDEPHIDRMLNVNVKGMILTVQKALPLMTKGGAIILSGSIVSIKGLANQSLYNASKAAVRSFARSWTSELRNVVFG